MPYSKKSPALQVSSVRISLIRERSVPKRFSTLPACSPSKLISIRDPQEQQDPQVPQASLEIQVPQERQETLEDQEPMYV